MAAAAAGPPLRVRRTGQNSWPPKHALAKALESDNNIRVLFRENKNQLLVWPSPELVGSATMKALSLNVHVVLHALDIWCESTAFPQAMVIDWLKQEVFHLHKLMVPGVDFRAVGIYTDAWGIKRLSSLAIRRWKAPIARLREARLML
ncbi:unnamed protein product [Symbiodinium sp. CCMP2592]|nr:unnamed protein product [Symbiodinium sp. CCMP2592]